MPFDLTRRRLVKIGAGVAAVGATNAAGCTSFLPGGPGYTSWLHEPGKIARDREHYSFSAVDVAEVRNNEDEFDSQVYDSFESLVEDMYSDADLDVEDVDLYVSNNVARIVTGSIDADDAGSELEDNDYDEDSDYEGYTIYSFEGNYGSHAFGVSGDAVILSSFDDPIGTVEDVIDVGNGNEDRYADENEDFELLVNELGTGAHVQGGTHEAVDGTDTFYGSFDEQVAGGSSVSVNGDTATGTWVRVFDDEDAIDLDEFEDWIDEADGSGGTFENYDDLEVSKSGRAAVVTGTIDTDELFAG